MAELGNIFEVIDRESPTTGVLEAPWSTSLAMLVISLTNGNPMLIKINPVILESSPLFESNLEYINFAKLSQKSKLKLQLLAEMVIKS